MSPRLPSAVPPSHIYTLSLHDALPILHAVGQVVNFYSTTELPPEVLVRAVNAHLPPDVSVYDAADVPQAFDANRDAKRKLDRKSTRLNSSHLVISYAVFCLKKKKHFTR